MTSSLATLEDRSLVALALGGHPEYFSVLMDRHLVAIRNRIRGMLRNEADPEDLLQDIVIKVWLHLSTFRWESSFRTWMTRVAINEVLQSYRRRRLLRERQAPDDLLAIPSSADSPHQTCVRAQVIQTVRNAVMELPSIYKRVLILHDLNELSLRETAQYLQSTVPAVKSRLFRARRMLSVAVQPSNRRGSNTRLSERGR